MNIYLFLLWAEDAGTGDEEDMATWATNEVPTGTINGVNAAFTLAHTPIAGSVSLFLNGVLQNPGAGNDYTISGAAITFLTAPNQGSTLLVSYRY